MHKLVSLLFIGLLLNACAGKPLGQIAPETLSADKRIVFGKVLTPSNPEGGGKICFIDARDVETCGSVAANPKYLKYEEEKQYYNYVAIALPPGPARISYFHDGKYTVNFSKGLDFVVDDHKPATYFGDVMILTIVRKIEAMVDNKAQKTFEGVKSVNPSLDGIRDYAISLANPDISYRGTKLGY